MPDQIHQSRVMCTHGNDQLLTLQDPRHRTTNLFYWGEVMCHKQTLRYLQGACQAGEGLHAQQVEQHNARAGVVAAVVEGRDVRVCKRFVPLLEELLPQPVLGFRVYSLGF